MEKLTPSQIQTFSRTWRVFSTCIFKPSLFAQMILKKRKLNWKLLFTYVLLAMSIEAVFMGFITIYINDICFPKEFDMEHFEEIRGCNIFYLIMEEYGEKIKSLFRAVPLLQVIDWASCLSGFIFLSLATLNPVLVHFWSYLLGKKGSLRHSIFILLYIESSLLVLTSLISYLLIVFPSFLNLLFPHLFSLSKLSVFLFGGNKFFSFISPYGFLYFRNYLIFLYLIILYMNVYRINWFQSIITVGSSACAYLPLLFSIAGIIAFLLSVISLIASLFSFVRFFF